MCRVAGRHGGLLQNAGSIALWILEQCKVNNSRHIRWRNEHTTTGPNNAIERRLKVGNLHVYHSFRVCFLAEATCQPRTTVSRK